MMFCRLRIDFAGEHLRWVPAAVLMGGSSSLACFSFYHFNPAFTLFWDFFVWVGIRDGALGGLQSLAGYLGLALVFVPGDALPG